MHASIEGWGGLEDDGAGGPRRLRDGWVAHIDAHEWSHWVTLTFRTPHSRDRALRAFEDVFVRRLARRAQRPIAWFVAVERSGPGAEWHIHALLYGTGSLSNAKIRTAWKLGLTRAERYNAGGGAARYVTKAVRDEDAWYDVSRRRPPLRRAA